MVVALIHGLSVVYSADRVIIEAEVDHMIVVEAECAWRIGAAVHVRAGLWCVLYDYLWCNKACEYIVGYEFCPNEKGCAATETSVEGVVSRLPAVFAVFASLLLCVFATPSFSLSFVLCSYCSPLCLPMRMI